jgi:Zn-dependent metalloprotease
MTQPSRSPYYGPDRKGSPYWHDYVRDPSDHGGVHTNCGVGNKLCSLLTDGGWFNGYWISGMGIDRTAGLFSEALIHLLTSAADYEDLYLALRQAAGNLGWTHTERQNLENACRAVEIATFWVLLNPVEAEQE